MRTPVALLAGLLLAAPAFAGAQTKTLPPPPPPPSMNTMPLTAGGRSNLRLYTEDAPRAATVEAPLDRGWPALKVAVAGLGIPVTTLIDDAHRIGFRGQRVRGKLGGLAVKRIVDCGQDQAGRDRADSYEVTLDYESVAAAYDGNTAVYSLVTGDARPVSTGGDPVRCVSTGRLEERVHEEMRAKAAAGR